jgi:hypothetical protein
LAAKLGRALGRFLTDFLIDEEDGMQKIALSVAALALTAGSALAADLPSRKGPPMLPPPPPPPMWTGFYVGVNAGGTWANSTNVNVASLPDRGDGLGQWRLYC